METRSKRWIFASIGILSLAIGVAITMIKCGSNEEKISNRIEKIIKEDSAKAKQQASYEDTAQFYLMRAAQNAEKANSVRGDSTSYARTIRDLESKIRLEVRAKRNNQ